MERKTIFLMLRLSPIPIALVATRQGSWPVLKLIACSFRHSGGSLPYMIAVQLFSFYTSFSYFSSFSPFSSFLPFSPSSAFSACGSDDAFGASCSSCLGLSLCSLSWTKRLMSFLCLRSEFMEKLMMQSPSLMFSNLNFLCIRVSLLSLEYRFSSSVSPVSSRILLMMLSALQSPQRWTRLALTASIARVQAQPRSVSPIICISSMTATSYSSLSGAAQMVQLTRLEFLNSFSCPVISEQFTSFCWYYQASSLSGAMQIPLSLGFRLRRSSTAAVDLPELVGPW